MPKQIRTLRTQLKVLHHSRDEDRRCSRLLNTHISTGGLACQGRHRRGAAVYP